ncbi:MAG TPA: potassium transporter TrkG, partial [Solirubrobacter sp.]|nr:potassium transporter TrkG [Solirubrobacter sp.]
MLAVVGVVLRWFSLSFVVPALIAVPATGSPAPFLLSGLATAAAGVALGRLAGRGGSEDEPLGLREAFLLLALLWLLVPAFGALPFLIGEVDQLGRPVDAYFEAVSGFTATGASVLADPERLDRAMQLWRQLSHWLGGMGIIVLAIAVLPRLRVGGR